MPDQPRRVRLAPSKDGYLLDDEFVPGFADDERLTDSQRRRIARWAGLLAPDQLTQEQTRLLGHELPSTYAWAMDDRDRVAAAPVRSVWRRLTEEQRRLVTHPEDRGFTYPLNVIQLSELVDATPRQIRHWAMGGLLPYYRDPQAPRDAFRFHSAAAIMAFGLTGADNADKAVLAKLARGQAAHLLALAASVVEFRMIDMVRVGGTVGTEEIASLRDLDDAAGEFLAEAERVTAAAGPVLDADQLPDLRRVVKRGGRSAKSAAEVRAARTALGIKPAKSSR